MSRTTFIIGDHTAAVPLTLRGPQNQIPVNNRYRFENVTVKTFQSKQIKKVSDMTDIVTDFEEEIADKQLTGTVTPCAIVAQYMCCFCKNVLNINEQIKAIKCPNCQKRQLLQTIRKRLTTEITVNVNNDMHTYTVPEGIMTIYTLGVDTYEDKELFFLNHNHIQFKAFQYTIKEITEIL